MRAELAFIASLPSGGPARRVGSRPEFWALQFLIGNYFRIANAATVRLAKSTHGPPATPCADSCTLAYYDSDVTPGFHYYKSEGTALNIQDIIGTAHARFIQRSKSSKTF
eukprot:5036123-Pyramimonas_sp.AAC.1